MRLPPTQPAIPRFAVCPKDQRDMLVRSFVTLEEALAFIQARSSEDQYIVLDGQKVVWQKARP